MTEIHETEANEYINNQLELEKWFAVPIQIVEYVKSKSFILLIETYLEMATSKQFVDDMGKYCSTLSPESIANPLNYKTYIKPENHIEEGNNAQECLKTVLLNLTTRAFDFIWKSMGNPFTKIYFFQDNHPLSVPLNVMALAVISEPNRFEKKD